MNEANPGNQVPRQDSLGPADFSFENSDDELTSAAIAAATLAEPGDDTDISNIFHIVSELQESSSDSSSELAEAAAAVMDLTSDYEDEPAGPARYDNSEDEIGPSAAWTALTEMDNTLIPGPYTASSFSQFQDDWLGSD
jgi:hypothetical protein